jgi:hypothetical protein
MKSPTLLLLVVLGIVCNAACGSAVAAEAAPAPQHPALYSFADVYRLTVSGPMAMPGLEPASQAPIRVAAPPAQLPSAAEPRFAIGAPRLTDKWLLLVAGLAFAGWVAHRRLVHSS